MVLGSSSARVRIVALGGLGEIGLNLLVLECAGRAVVIDAGLMFARDRAGGETVLAPDLGYFERSGVQVDAVVLTHAHDDHVGALPHLLRRLGAVAVYGSPVTLAFARLRLHDARLGHKLKLHPIAPRSALRLGAFELEALRVTHSTPDALALAIRTPAGTIVHTGDFKIDEAPVDGERFDRERFGALGEEGVGLLLSDSTNVERPGRSGSESSLKPVLTEIVRRTRGNFVISAFSSHLHRIRQAAAAAREAGRAVVPLGRRVAESVRIGRELGQLPLPADTFISRAEAALLPAKRLAFIAGGSQGEPFSALARLAAGSHPRLRVESGDTVVLSARFVPGNERTINELIDRLARRGADVYYEPVAPVHVSGHAYREELAEMIRLTRPRYFVPVHGEYRHLSRHVALAVAAGVPRANCFLLEDGEPLILDAAGARREPRVGVGQVVANGAGSDSPRLARERLGMGRAGAVFALLAVSAQSGAIVAGPELISRGVADGDGTSALIVAARAELAGRLRRLKGPLRAADKRLEEEIVSSLRGYFDEAAGRVPVIVPCVTEV